MPILMKVCFAEMQIVMPMYSIRFVSDNRAYFFYPFPICREMYVYVLLMLPPYLIYFVSKTKDLEHAQPICFMKKRTNPNAPCISDVLI